MFRAGRSSSSAGCLNIFWTYQQVYRYTLLPFGGKAYRLKKKKQKVHSVCCTIVTSQLVSQASSALALHRERTIFMKPVGWRGASFALINNHHGELYVLHRGRGTNVVYVCTCEVMAIMVVWFHYGAVF